MFSKNKNDKKKLEGYKILSAAGGGNSVGSETCRRNKK